MSELDTPDDVLADMEPPPTVLVGSEAEREELGAHLTEIKRVLAAGPCRIEFGFAFSVAGTMATAQVYERRFVPYKFGSGGKNQWLKVGPFLTTKEGTRASLLKLLAHLTEEQS